MVPTLLRFMLVSLLSTAAVVANVYTEPAIFERLSHFKDYGVPGTVNDPLNQAMIADASCRAVTSDEFAGFDFYHDQAKVTDVLAALSNLPSTAGPSHFTLTAHEQMPAACGAPAAEPASSASDYRCSTLPLESLTGSMDNWHRALCAPPTDPSWGSTYDPAYQPQQVALTAGFMCIVACDCAESDLDASTLALFALSEWNAKRANRELCSAIPYRTVNFTAQATTPSQLAKVSAPLQRMCGCDGATTTAATAGSRARGFWDDGLVAGLSVCGLLVMIGSVVIYRRQSGAGSRPFATLESPAASPNDSDDTLATYEGDTLTAYEV